MPKLALYTFGIFNAPADSNEMKDFWARVPQVFEQAASIDGFLGRSGYPNGTFGEMPVWGEMTVPRFFNPTDHPGQVHQLQTLSLWQDAESASAFAYHGTHGDALKQRNDWFQQPEWPTMVTWWVPDDQTPTWQEGATQLESLADNGPTAQAFDLAHPFNVEGKPATINRELVRDKRAAAGI